MLQSQLTRTVSPHVGPVPRECTAFKATRGALGSAQACSTHSSSSAFLPLLRRCGSSHLPLHLQRVARPQALPHIVSSAAATVAASPNRDQICFVAAAIGAAIWVKIFDLLAAKGVLDQKLSRKLVHSTAGPLFVLTWPLFSADPAARFIAAVVPFLNFIRLFSVGTGIYTDNGLINSVSRTGDKGELLKGPLYYCIVLIGATILCWRDNPAGLIAIALMCGGDGLADIIGRRFGRVKLPYNTGKSFAGSLAMFAGGMAMSIGLILLFCGLGFFSCYSPEVLFPQITVICLAATLVESLPINQVFDDNLSVPGVAVVLSMLLLPQPVAMVM